MSNFLFIIPDNWIVVDWPTAQAANSDLIAVNIENWAASGQYHYIVEALSAQGMLKPTDNVIDAKIFNNEVFAILLG